MVKKTVAKKTEETPEETPVEAVTLTTTSTVDDTTTKKATKKSTRKVTEPVTSETTVTENQVVENVTTVSDVSVLADSFTEFMTKFQTLVQSMSQLKVDFKALEKKAVREIKLAQKEKAKRRRKTGNRSPSGFVKPTLISSELAKFLNKPTGTEMARTEVTREINGYIRQNSLQDKDNGRKINPDKALANLLKIKNGEELTYFNLQRYMSPHFAKANSSPVATTSGAATA
jgi:upstream activation factor subunit UAF30